ncbi:hypothetical protein Pmar_PMAR013817 [Perkinsus marinus ATCC 50983]|uniref:Uncharacterized protein n=1 Tax=Perkinsus marinus (strain ATCC 50983 / TXsc) TaxID=423536 RepID=C5L903_PERM5|nr:hypothetical protein Pmar_PMAR013817 [Perkinsus marinus ATCC 50983]EER06767.1 hypothetical protein Pmar_PMAR013817 [Perkinsus marinus ATCC 50983]|eukprot:XP_002774951.1 hypothetical protein Pmar_PMAR013817 [Perkinsus marinus ATCC 50983]
MLVPTFALELYSCVNSQSLLARWVYGRKSSQVVPLRIIPRKMICVNSSGRQRALVKMDLVSTPMICDIHPTRPIRLREGYNDHESTLSHAMLGSPCVLLPNRLLIVSICEEGHDEPEQTAIIQDQV